MQYKRGSLNVRSWRMLTAFREASLRAPVVAALTAQHQSQRLCGTKGEVVLGYVLL